MHGTSTLIPHEAPSALTSHGFRSYVHGQRVVYPCTRDTPEGDWIQFVVVLDFNVHPKRLECILGAKELARDSFDRTKKTEVMYEPEPLQRRVVGVDRQQVVPVLPFTEVVTTHLPYVKTMKVVDRRPEKRMSHFMMDDERLIELNVSGGCVFLPRFDLHRWVRQYSQMTFFAARRYAKRVKGC